MRLLSADAAKAGAADMTFDEINAEIVVARNEKVKFLRLLKRSKKFGFAKGRIDEAISQIVSLGCVSCNVRFFNSIFFVFFLKLLDLLFLLNEICRFPCDRFL